MVMKSRICVVSGIFVLSMLTVYCFGAPEPKNPQTPEPKISETTGKIQQMLDQILPQVNQERKPSQSNMSACQKTLDESKRHFLGMDDKQKAQYCLLQSWVAYYSDDTNNAHLNAAKACKLDATSGDAWITQVAMSLLADKRPMLPRPPRPARVQRNRPGQAGMESPETAHGVQDSAAQIQKGKLDFDLNLFLPEAVGKKIEPLQLNCLNGTTLSYQPGNEALCVLFWREFESKTKTTAAGGDPNRAARVSPQPMAAGPMMEGEMMGATTSEATPIAAFGKLFQAGFLSGRMKFLAVNLDSAANKQAVVDGMIERPQPWAQVMMAGQAEGLFSDFSSIPAGRPILMMTDMSGTVRYAGPATGIIAPMLLNKIASAADFAPSEATQEQIEPSSIPTDANSVPHIEPMDGNSLPQTGPVAQPPQPIQRPTRQPTVPQQGQYKELSEEDKIQAERKLQAAKDLFMPLGRKMGMTYKRGVEICRGIMREYPGSEYAEQARQLLRQVPENQRSRYGITDQELGL